MDNKIATTLRQEFQPTLRSNMQKTLWLLLDGEEHGLKEMREFAGDAVQTRVRDLRKHSGV